MDAVTWLRRAFEDYPPEPGTDLALRWRAFQNLPSADQEAVAEACWDLARAVPNVGPLRALEIVAAIGEWWVMMEVR